MFETLKRLWLQNKVNEDKLNRAVEMGFITEIQKLLIMAL
jgi:hypothetical protein